MKSENDSFTSQKYSVNSFDKDKLPLEVGLSTLINVFFWRFLSILLASIPTFFLLAIAALISDYSQVVSSGLLIFVVIVFFLFTISIFRQKSTSFDKVLKRLIDVLISLLSLIFLAPLLLLIAIAIKIESKGPIIFYQERLGKDGKLFMSFRFRTMKPDHDNLFKSLSEKEGATLKVKSDPRVTSIGSFLRRTSLDQIPQLFNVLRGEMSLIGPSPLHTSLLNKFDEEYLGYYKSVKPGLTGLWQVSTINDPTDDDRIKLDEYYIKNWSLLMDIIILFKTLTSVLRKQGAY